MKNVSSYTNVSVTDIKCYEFKGSGYDIILTPEQLVDLGLTEQPGELDIEGDYHIIWDHNLPFVYVDGVCVWSDKHVAWVYLNEDQVDFTKISDQIERDGPAGDWETDKIASMSDYAYESYRDAN